MTTSKQARDEMLGVLRDAVAQGGYLVMWPDQANPDPPTGAPWMRPSIQHTGGGQTSLADSSGAALHTAKGILTIQVMSPMGDGNTMGYDLAELVLAAYRRAKGSVWYRNQHIKDAGDDGAFTLRNVLIEFNYDQKVVS